MLFDKLAAIYANLTESNLDTPEDKLTYSLAIRMIERQVTRVLKIVTKGYERKYEQELKIIENSIKTSIGTVNRFATENKEILERFLNRTESGYYNQAVGKGAERIISRNISPIEYFLEVQNFYEAIKGDPSIEEQVKNKFRIYFATVRTSDIDNLKSLENDFILCKTCYETLIELTDSLHVCYNKLNWLEKSALDLDWNKNHPRQVDLKDISIFNYIKPFLQYQVKGRKIKNISFEDVFKELFLRPNEDKNEIAFFILARLSVDLILFFDVYAKHEISNNDKSELTKAEIIDKFISFIKKVSPGKCQRVKTLIYALIIEGSSFSKSFAELEDGDIPVPVMVEVKSFKDFLNILAQKIFGHGTYYPHFKGIEAPDSNANIIDAFSPKPIHFKMSPEYSYLV